MKAAILLLIFCIFCTAGATPSSQAVQVYVQMLKEKVDTQDAEKKLYEEFSQCLIKNDLTAYENLRKELSWQLSQALDNEAWFWIDKWDSLFFQKYVLAQVAEWNKVAEPGPQMAAEFKDALAARDIRLSDLKHSLIGTTFRNSRGIYIPDSRQVSLELLAPDEMHLVLAHEFAHFTDPNLALALDEEALAQLKFSMLNFEFLPVEEWTAVQKNDFAKYWFHKVAYLNIAEWIPQLRSCQIVTPLAQKKILNLGPDLLNKIGMVIKNRISCHDWVTAQIPLEQRHIPLFLFWPPGTPQYELVGSYYLNWRQKYGFTKSPLPLETF